MKFGVVVFPGSNCDHDTFHVLGSVLGQPVEFIWHQDEKLPALDAIVLPGGFSFGDYLRTGAIARFSPVMKAVARFARDGGPVLGICNGFQILCEMRLLPGALVRNARLRFLCRDVNIKVEQADTAFTCAARIGDVLRIPIAHGEGNYVCSAETLAELERERRVIFRYTTPQGLALPEANPNGSTGNIAGICNRERNVLGLMPHPERASEAALGSADGLVVFQSLVASLARTASVPA